MWNPVEPPSFMDYPWFSSIFAIKNHHRNESIPRHPTYWNKPILDLSGNYHQNDLLYKGNNDKPPDLSVSTKLSSTNRPFIGFFWKYDTHRYSKFCWYSLVGAGGKSPNSNTRKHHLHRLRSKKCFCSPAELHRHQVWNAEVLGCKDIKAALKTMIRSRGFTHILGTIQWRCFKKWADGIIQCGCWFQPLWQNFKVDLNIIRGWNIKLCLKPPFTFIVHLEAKPTNSKPAFHHLTNSSTCQTWPALPPCLYFHHRETAKMMRWLPSQLGHDSTLVSWFDMLKCLWSLNYIKYDLKSTWHLVSLSCYCSVGFSSLDVGHWLALTLARCSWNL